MPELKTVSAKADFLINGYVDPREPLREEGPFGDNTGYKTLRDPSPVLHVTAKTPSSGSVNGRYPCHIADCFNLRISPVGGAKIVKNWC